jgi:hypothetical protein
MNKRSNELITIDKLFQQQYEMMIQRHEKEFILLHERVKTKVSATKNQVDYYKREADSMKKMNESRVPVAIMEFVSRNGIHEESKKRVFNSMSPRRQTSPV